MTWVSSFPERFKELTQHQTYAQVSDYLGISKTAVSYYLSGQRKPKQPTLKYIASKYGVNPLWLLGGDVPRDWVGEDRKGPGVASSLSDAALEVAKIYDTLDPYGQDAVREVAKIEQARCEDEDRLIRMTTPEMEEEEIVIDDFTFAPAAGPLLGVAGQEREPYTLQPGDPKGAVYTTRVSGDSMEPYFPDGSRIFVNLDEVRNGDVGIFCVDGATVVKQFYRDPLGMIYLFSLNRKRDDADLVFGPHDRRTLVCQGRVMTRQRFPLPV